MLKGRDLLPADRSLDDVVRDYKRLTDVEKSFRTIKTTLPDMRPIFHRLENRVRSHLFLCMLSYYVVFHLRQAWADDPTSFRTLLGRLSTLCRNTCVAVSRLGEARFERLTLPTPYQEELYSRVKRIGQPVECPAEKTGEES